MWKSKYAPLALCSSLFCIVKAIELTENDVILFADTTCTQYRSIFHYSIYFILFCLFFFVWWCYVMFPKVGDIVRMENNQFIAADVMLLSTSEPNGLCYIETAELDGETNLKARQSLTETSEMGQDHELLSQFNGEIVCEPPNNILNKFDGTLIWNNQRYPVDNDKILLRGCVLRNTQWCYGIVIFAGKDTKLMQNSGKTSFKSTSIDRFLNYIIIGVSIQSGWSHHSQFYIQWTDNVSTIIDLFADCVIFNIDMLLLYDCVRCLGNDDWSTFYGKCQSMTIKWVKLMQLHLIICLSNNPKRCIYHGRK